MCRRFLVKALSVFLATITFLLAMPLSVLAEEISGDAKGSGYYLETVKLTEGLDRDQAKKTLEQAGYTFLDSDLNKGTGEGSVYLGYTVTTDPAKAIYDIKIMNMNGGFSLTSIDKAVEAQMHAMSSMASDLTMLIYEFGEVFDDGFGTVAAQKAFKLLNFFRLTKDDNKGDYLGSFGNATVSGTVTSLLLEMLLFCDAEILNCLIQALTTGILGANGNWLEKLSEEGPYNEFVSYGEDEAELERRASQLLPVLQVYAQAYRAMEATGALSGTFNESFELINQQPAHSDEVTAQDNEVKNLDISRAKLYKVAFEELEKYPYGNGTLRDFFAGIEDLGDTRQLYPLVSVLSDGEYAAMSYGNVLELIVGADYDDSAFEHFDRVYEELTKTTDSIYIFEGVDEVLLDRDTVVAFTAEANRHVADTGEMEFYENDSWSDKAWETGKNVAKAVACIGTASIAIAKTVVLTGMWWYSTVSFSTLAAKSGIVGPVMKACIAVGGVKGMIVAVLVVVAVYVVSFIVSRISEWVNSGIDWEENPIPDYIYDITEINLVDNSGGGGNIEYMKSPGYVFYEVVTDPHGNKVDLNAHSDDASQWIAMYVSYDILDSTSKPIEAKDLLVKYGNGETPEGYTPLREFGEVVAKDLNSYDDENSVNGVYFFYKQDNEISVETNRTYYISDVYLQTGKSTEHCISKLEAAGYTPININMSPDTRESSVYAGGGDKIYTYLGYKITASESMAIRDLRMSYETNASPYNHGGSSYGEHGTSAGVTLYASKQSTTGTPILAGGLLITRSRNGVPKGYEPVNFFTGGPAMTFNFDGTKISGYAENEVYLYFLPEVTFTEGEAYLGGLMHLAAPNPEFRDYAKVEEMLYLICAKSGKHFEQDTYSKINEATRWLILISSGYDYAASNVDTMKDTFLYSKTYNPYRAIYDVKLTSITEMPDEIVYDGKGYSAVPSLLFSQRWSGPRVESEFLLNNDQYSKLNGVVYVSGNPAGNVYDSNKKEMSSAQPLKLSEFLCVEERETFADDPNSGFTRLTDLYSAEEKDIVIKNKGADTGFKFYLAREGERELPYVGSIFVTDTASIYREMGGAESGVSSDMINRGMALSSLGSKGARLFCAESTKIYGWVENANIKRELLANTLYYGYSKTEKTSEALTDLFIYYDGITDGGAPSEMYRGSIKYYLICELPIYNLTGVEDSPAPRIYLYGTTNKKAGAKIVDFTVSESPFMEGYDTVLSYNGGSVWAEILEHLEKDDEKNPLLSTGNITGQWLDFFTIMDDKDHGAWNRGMYLHIKREGATKEELKPYIGELFVVQMDDNTMGAREKLFAMGADGMLETDLNEDAGGDQIYLGYKLTSDPTEAITDISAYHKKDHPSRLTDSLGVEYSLVSGIDINDGAGWFSDYIYLYATKDPAAGNPISGLDIVYKVANYDICEETEDGGSAVIGRAETMTQWESKTYSDLNEDGGGKYLYLVMTRYEDNPEGGYVETDYGKDRLTSRVPTAGSEEGKYIAALYVMDKNTLRQEKLASGVASKDCECADIPDSEVIDRLYEMGATHVLDGYILAKGQKYSGYGTKNANKVFIGYSRTDNLRLAIKDIMLYVEPYSSETPRETMSYNRKAYKIVAEGARGVTKLPEPINLIGLEDGQDSFVPRIYLYTSTSGTEPIYDIRLTTEAISENWRTALSQNGKEAYADISEQSAEIYDKLKKDVDKPYSDVNFSSYYLTDLYEFTERIFGAEDREVSSWYLQFKNFEGNSIEDIKPYISEVFVAEGGSKEEALRKLLANDPDGYVDMNLNSSAGGRHVYIGYKRTADKDSFGSAITSLAVFKGGSPAKAHYVDVADDVSIRYELAGLVDLNSGAGGDKLYLFSTTNESAGDPLLDITVTYVAGSAPNGVNRRASAVRGIKNGRYIDQGIDVNGGVDDCYSLYIIMHRARSSGANTSASLVGDGSFLAVVGFVILASIAAAVGIICLKKRSKNNDKKQ